ncbi:MAG: ATP-binding cassette domain-containing protein, partial [Rhizobiales bacterium]|nr:ATP-binding cassette domain-containing protein [Hyphomicrobiales bacterium]
MARLDLIHVTAQYDGAPEPVLADVSLSLGGGEFVAVIGRSGCGKTTLLNLAAGFASPVSGRVTFDGRDVKGPGPERAVVFQDDALFPWLSALDNIAFGLHLRGVAKTERRLAARRLLAEVGLKGLDDRPIWRLSGGQRQRIGLARALAIQPAFLLMDEPLGALDAMTRERMQELLLGIFFQTRAGVLLITHSVEEALFLATRIIVMAPNPGRIVQTLDVDFSRRIHAGESARAIKSSPDFTAARTALLDL